MTAFICDAAEINRPIAALENPTTLRSTSNQNLPLNSASINISDTQVDHIVLVPILHTKTVSSFTGSVYLKTFKVPFTADSLNSSESCGNVLIDMSTNAFSTTVSNMAYSGRENDHINLLGLYEEDRYRFDKILHIMNLDKIPSFASNVRQHGHRSTSNSVTQGLSEPCLISCKIVTPPLCGSYHIVFPIEFADGVKWMLKISANGDHFDSVAAAALASEARTMQMLRRKTSIPVPTVYAFDTSSDNALLTPFILMEKLDGKPLCYLWFNDEVPKARLEHFRIKTLQSLAGAMVQLNRFTLHTSGSLVFDSDGSPVGLGGAKVVDGVATFNKTRARQLHQQKCDEGGDNTLDELRVEAATSNGPNASGCSQVHINNSEGEDIFWERGPFSCSKAYFMSNLDRSDPAFRADAYERGTDMCLRLFIEWAFADSRNRDRRFVLAHPDLDVQNILVADDGTLTGLIDWDGVAAVPREVGCAQYPLWLMRDWVPLRYKYDIEKGEPCADAGYEESSPAELASYRALYTQLMEVEIEKMTGGSNQTTTFGTLPKHEAEITRRSLVMRNLDLSAGDPWVALPTVNHIIDQIEELTVREWEDADSGIDSLSSCSGDRGDDSDSDSTIDSEIGKEEAETPVTDEQCSSGRRDGDSTHQAAQELGGTECIVPEVIVKVNHSSRGVAEQDQISPSFSDARRIDAEEPKTQESPKMELPDEFSTPSAPLGWTRRFLRFCCNTAEKSLRRIAKIGYALENAVDDIAEVLAEGEGKDAEASVEGNSGQMVNSDIPQQTTAVKLCEDVETRQGEDRPSTQDTGGPKQRNNVRSIEPTSYMQAIPSTQTVVNGKQIKSAHAIPATIEPHGLPLRKAELLQAVRMEKKAERKAHYLADKAKIKKELKVWEHIALAVWRRGISLEQLEVNQGMIARWVVDTLEAEQDHKDGLTANINHPPAAEVTAASAGKVDGRAAAPSLLEDHCMQSKEEPEEVRLEGDVLQTAKVKGDKQSTASKDIIARSSRLKSKPLQISIKEPLITAQHGSAPENRMSDVLDDNKDEPERQDGWAGRLNLGRKNMVPNEEATSNLTKVIKAQPLSAASSTSGDHVLSTRSKASYGLRSLCKSGTSYISQIFFNHSQTKEDKSGLSPESSVLNDSCEDKEEGESDTGNSNSSTTSLSDGEAEAKEDDKVKEDTGDTSEFTFIAVNIGDSGEGNGDEDDDKPHEDGREEGEMKEAVGRTNFHAHEPFVKGSFGDDGTISSCASRRVNDPCGRDALEASKVDESTKDESTTATSNDETRVQETIDTGHVEVGANTDGEDGHEDRASKDQGDNESSSGGVLPAFEDHGGFDRYTICNLLGMGELDELRLLRLKDGFLKLLEQY